MTSFAKSEKAYGLIPAGLIARSFIPIVAGSSRAVELGYDQIAHSICFVDPDGHRLEITTYEISPLQEPA